MNKHSPRHVALAIPFCPATHRVLLITSRKHPNLWIRKSDRLYPASSHSHAFAPLRPGRSFSDPPLPACLKTSPSLACPSPFRTFSDRQFPRAASMTARPRARPPPARRRRKVSVGGDKWEATAGEVVWTPAVRSVSHVLPSARASRFDCGSTRLLQSSRLRSVPRLIHPRLRCMHWR